MNKKMLIIFTLYFLMNVGMAVGSQRYSSFERINFNEKMTDGSCVSVIPQKCAVKRIAGSIAIKPVKKLSVRDLEVQLAVNSCTAEEREIRTVKHFAERYARYIAESDAVARRKAEERERLFVKLAEIDALYDAKNAAKRKSGRSYSSTSSVSSCRIDQANAKERAKSRVVKQENAFAYAKRYAENERYRERCVIRKNVIKRAAEKRAAVESVAFLLRLNSDAVKN